MFFIARNEETRVLQRGVIEAALTGTLTDIDGFDRGLRWFLSASGKLQSIFTDCKVPQHSMLLT